jgi:hypothetical protein
MLFKVLLGVLMPCSYNRLAIYACVDIADLIPDVIFA